MRTLHALAILSFLVLGMIALGSYQNGLIPGWKALLIALGAPLLPYAFALGFALSVAPPNFYEMWQKYRRSRGKRLP